MSELLKLAERVARKLSSPRVRAAYDSLASGKHDWEQREYEGWHRTRPYPMGFYPHDPRLYYAIGWGNSEHMLPHERWLMHRAAALRARASTPNEKG